MSSFLTISSKDIDNARSEEIRSKRKIQSVQYGSSQCWVPAGTEIVAKNHLASLKKSATVTKKLEDLFSCEKSCFSHEALSIMVAGNLHNYGGSDEAMEMVIDTAYDVLFYDIRFDCDPASLGKGCPCQRTIARAKLHIATDCSLEVMQEIKI